MDNDRIAVLITSFNRKAKTLACVERLFASPEGRLLDVYLLDDGSSDGTSNAIEQLFPGVKLTRGDGSYYWSGGLRLIFGEASKGGYRAYLWLNDDNILDADALTRLLGWLGKTQGNSILGGSMRGMAGTEITYGGRVRTSVHPMRFRLVQPADNEPLPVDVLNGNFYLVPRQIADALGPIDPGLVQQGADYVYCVRARRAGFGVLLLPGSYGECSLNDWGKPVRGMAGLRKILKSRHLPVGPTAAFYRVMAGPTWPFWLLALYVRAVVRGY